MTAADEPLRDEQGAPRNGSSGRQERELRRMALLHRREQVRRARGGRRSVRLGRAGSPGSA